MLAAYAQEEIHLNKVPEMLNEAGSKLPIPEKPLLFDDSFSITRFSLTDNSLFNQPLIPNYIKNLDFTKYLGKSIETGYTSYQTIQDMSIKGASMILQYKVSDKIKVQTRVSISTGQSPWEP
jgi:hypothetical protein